MKFHKLDLIDFEKVNTLLEGFNKSTGFVTAILDFDGNVLSKSGWRQICTEFHRINPETAKKCTISDTELAGKMAEGETYHFYKCLNGLIDVAVPVVINGEHIANLFSGQFFFEEPDISFFKKQAEAYGFDEEKYLNTLKSVPVVSKEKVKTAMDFLLDMTRLISETAFQKLEQIELTKTIEEREEKFKAVFESANVGKSMTLPTGEIYVNQSFCDMLGYTREELKAKKWQDITPQEEIPDVQKILAPLLKGEKDSARFEKRYLCKDGTAIWADVNTSIKRDNKGKPLYFITTVIDITERRIAEVQLRDSERDFRAIFENATIGIATIESDTGRFLRINQSYCKMVQYSLQEILQMNFQQITHPDDLHADLDNMNRLKTGQVGNFSMDKRYVAKDGSIIWASMTVIPLIFENDRLSTHLALVTDITERKQAERLNRESAERAKKQRNLIAKLFFEDVIINKPIDEALKILTTQLAEILQVERTSVWLLSDDDKLLIRRMLFDTASGIDSQIEVLNTVEFPSYFKALYKDSQIDADDAQTDPRTRQLSDIYFIPLRISSMLDSAIQRDGRIIGVLSAEHRGPVREWYADEESFLSSLTNLVSQLFANAERKRAEEALQQQADELRTSNIELEQFNRAMVGRESFMIELKQDINELCRRLGEPPRHKNALPDNRVPGDGRTPDEPGGGGV